MTEGALARSPMPRRPHDLARSMAKRDAAKLAHSRAHLHFGLELTGPQATEARRVEPASLAELVAEARAL